MANKQTGKISFQTASSIVIANMIGAGVFTSLGFQIGGGIESVFPLIMLWVVGGVIALCGALSYGELAGMMPRSGGEYHYLSEIYHPAVGFLSGWISMTVGFAAPVAAAAVALGKYAQSVFPVLNATVLGVIVVLLLTFIHASDLKAGSIFQNISTSVKLGLIVFFSFCGLFFIGDSQPISVLPKPGDQNLIFGSSFAVSLIFVSYAYSGWNASAYLAGEIDNPKKNVPRSLFFGTLIVMLTYVVLNFVFLYTVPTADLKGQLEIGYISANHIFGPTFGGFMGMMIALLLVSSISSMIFAGPRVTQVMGEDIPLLKRLAFKSKKELPVTAIILQAVISIILILSASFDSIIKYVGFTLSLFTFMTVLGVFVLRITRPHAERPYKAWGYPLTPLIFLALTGWTLFYLLQGKESRTESLYGLGTVLLGLLIFLLDRAINGDTNKKSSHSA
ncbi:MAG: amino acid permease [Microscillaceae bacterium]|nr:amino acid permease [Microscillaceae bacterium]